MKRAIGCTAILQHITYSVGFNEINKNKDEIGDKNTH